MFTCSTVRSLLIQRKFANVMSKKLKGKAKEKNKESVTNSKEESPISINKSNDIIIAILAKPGARQNAITNISSEGVGVQINAPPSEGEANAELIKYMATILGLRKSDVFLEKGFKSRNKTLKVTGNISLEEIKNKLLKEMDNS